VLASGSRDCTLALWDPASGQEQGRIEVVTNGINSIAFSADGGQVLLSNVDGSVGLWDLGSKSLVREMTGHRYPSWSAGFHPDGRTVASGSADKSIIFWDPDTGAERKRLEGHEKDVYSIVFSPDGGMLFSASADGSIRVWPLDVSAEQWTTLAAAWRAADAEDRARRSTEQAAAPPEDKPKGLLGRMFGRR
jgi:WD40 repeat protein